MKKKLIGTLLALSVTVASITPLAHAEESEKSILEGWKVNELTSTKGDYTFTYYKSKDEKSSWLTKITIDQNKGMVKSLTIPDTLGGSPVTRIGYDYITRDSKSPDDYCEFGQTIFGEYVEEAHGCDGSFNDISNITNLSIPDTVQTIDWDSFSGLDSLTEVRLPNSLTKLGNSAFYGCDQLKKITIGASLSEFNTNSFASCPKLKTVTVTKKNKTFYAKNNILIKKKGKTMVWAAPANKKLVIPNGTKKIGDYCFYSSKINSITIPKSIKKIGKKALEASKLTKITLKKGNKTYAKDGSTIYNKKTKELVVAIATHGGEILNISPKVKKITSAAMTAGDNFIINDGSSLSYVVIPSSVTLCDSWYEFYHAGYITCNLVFSGKKTPKYAKKSKNLLPVFCTYYVPKSSIKKYRNWVKNLEPDYFSYIKLEACTSKIKKTIK